MKEKKEKTFQEFMRMARAGLSDEQVLSSSAMHGMFANIAAFVTERYGRRCQITLEHSGDGKGTAYTDGNNITVDVDTSLVDGLELRDKIKYLIGLLYHETGHVLFTDFVIKKKGIQALTGGTLFPVPVGISADVDKAYAQFLMLAANEKLRPPLTMLWTKIDNIMEDGAIEYFLKALFPGYAGCLTLVRTRAFEESPRLEQLTKEDACINLLAQEATSHDHKGELSCIGFDLTDFYGQVLPLIGQATTERNAKKRKKLMNAVFLLTLMEIGIPNPVKGSESNSSEGGGKQSRSGQSDQNSSGTSGEGVDSEEKHQEEGSNAADGSSTGDFSSETSAKDPSSASGETSTDDLEKRLEQIAQKKHAGETTVPKGKTSSVKIDEKEEGEENDEKNKEETEKWEKKLQKGLDRLISEAIQNRAEQLAEEEVEKNLREEAATPDTIGEEYTVQRVKIDDNADMDLYNQKMKELSNVIAIMTRLLSREIEDRKIGEIQHGKIYGKAIDPSSIYRRKGGKMMTRKNPEDKPDMAVMCLIDESGSMSLNNKIAAATDAAIIVNGFCEKLSLPVSIYGHSTSWTSCTSYKTSMFSYKEFGFDGDRKTGRRLMEIKARECNRDGTAIRFCAKKLAAREEHVKLLLIVSDGLPSAYGKGENACADVRQAVSEARRKGITVVTAGIGADRECIKSVYVNSSVKPKDMAIYLDISDLNALPKELVKIIKRNIQMVL